jgi:hypothetical protein
LDDDKGSVVGRKSSNNNRKDGPSPVFTSNSTIFFTMHFTRVLSGLGKTVFVKSSSIAGGVDVLASGVFQVQA